MQLSEKTGIADRFELARMIGSGAIGGQIWREAQAAAPLRSAHVMHTFDKGVGQGHPSIAIERPRGATTPSVAAPAASKEKPINLGF